MHDRKKGKRDAKELEILKLKVYKYSLLKNDMLDKKSKQVYSPEILTSISTLLLIGPEFYTMWNYRKEILSTLKDTPEYENTLLKELELTENILKTKGSKSYSVWSHREFCVRQLPKTWEGELVLCSLMLKFDERNFHCWNYRNVIVDLLHLDNDKNLAFVQSKIENNPSNYSAWHNRSYLVKDKHAEMDLVKNAFYTIPHDQSAWIYHRWLNYGHDENLSVCNDLLEIEPDCKWAYITILNEDKVRIRENIAKLVKLDPDHIGYYQDVLSDHILTNEKNWIGQGLTRMNALSDLKIVDLSNNKIRMIPKLKLKNLEKLILSFNEIEFVESLEECVELRELLVDNNKITKLNMSELVSSGLVKLDVSKNPLRRHFEITELKLEYPELKELIQ
jgi:geranylgeranyl transferase type-2 subunit alpha